MKNHLPDHYCHPLPGGISYPMVRVQPGTFVMGSEGEEADDDEKPEHLIHITYDYYIGVFPVTQAVWKAVMDGHNPSGFNGDNRPVENVSWLDVVYGLEKEKRFEQGFLDRLNHLFHAKAAFAGFRFRLPTEAEWEYAAKGGHLTALPATGYEKLPKASELYTLYAGSDKLKEVGWYRQNSHRETKIVGLKRPNELGLYDMSGNVWEWCEDTWHSDYKGAPTDGSAWDSNSDLSRVLRGGSWVLDAHECRSTDRKRWHSSNARFTFFGFRLVLKKELPIQ